MSTAKQTDPRLTPRHSIGVVSRRTGISQLVLRAWERRYDAVVPGRTATGRRKYTDADVEKLFLLGRLTAGGHRIGDVAHLGLEELKDLVREIGDAGPGVGAPAAAAAPVVDLLDDALAAVANLDAHGLEAVLDRALVDLSKPLLRRQLLVPLLQEIGNRWRDGELRVAHEHMASSIVVAFLTALNRRYQVALGAPVLAVATPAGQMHELGALLASSHAFEAGWDVLYLGSNLPAEDIAAAVKRRGARGVLLSLVFPYGDARTGSELRELRRLLGPEPLIFTGGQAAASYDSVLTEIDATVFADCEAMARSLPRI